MLTCGELLVKLLEDFGVDTVFGIPGVHTVELYRGLPATRIRHITPRHEQGAGFMADGYARVSGKPGVCFIITGPGMTNILTAMGQAYGDSIPMLVISSVNNTEQLGMGGGRLHELPSQRSLSANVTAFSHTLMRPDELPAILTRAFAIFGSARPRPVHIEIPINVITASADHVSRKRGAIPSRPAPCPAAISRAVEVLTAARRPIIFLGGGASHAAAEARQLVEALDAPTACTINAKGILPKGHPLSLGSNTSFRPVRELVRASDAVLAIGTEMGETDYDLVADGKLRIECPLVRIDLDPEQINRNFLADVAILSDAKLAIAALLARIEKRGTPSRESAGAKLTAETRLRLDAQWPAAWRGQRKTLEALQDALPEAIIVGDSTQPVYSGNHLFEANAPHSWFNSATGYGTLGYGLPAAVGAKLAAPNRPVVALIGDGGIQFTLPELGSAIEARAPIIVLLWNNEGYGEIKRYMQERGIPTIGVDIYTPDLLAIATGFGCKAARASSLGHLRELLLEAARADRPTVIEVREDADFLKAPSP
jgi:acetolactate synthase-1/2/3 large subunit